MQTAPIGSLTFNKINKLLNQLETTIHETSCKLANKSISNGQIRTVYNTNKKSAKKRHK